MTTGRVRSSGKSRTGPRVLVQQRRQLGLRRDDLHRIERVHVRPLARAPPRLHPHQPGLGQGIQRGFGSRGRVLHGRAAPGLGRVEHDLARAVANHDVAHPGAGVVVAGVDSQRRRGAARESLRRSILGLEQRAR